MSEADFARIAAARSKAESFALERPHDPGRPWYRYAEALLPADPGRWVDLGCGQGEFVSRALRLRPGLPSPIPFALDRARANAGAARRGGAAALAADLAEGLPFADRSLDGAALIEVIEHIANAEHVVDELARVLRPGGWLLVTTPNVAHLTYRLRALTGHPPKQEGYHLRFFTAKTLRACLEARGFQVERRGSFGKQALLTKLARLIDVASGRSGARRREDKVRYRVPAALEPLLAQHFVWLLRRRAPDTLD